MRKKRKLKPSSEALKVLNVLQTDANTSVKELVEKTGLSTAQIYSARHYLKKRGLVKPNAVKAKTVKPKPTRDPLPKQTADDKEIENILKENRTLTDWTVMWRRKCDSLESELNRVRHLYMDQLAVVRYLETKLMQFVEANLSEKEKS